MDVFAIGHATFKLRIDGLVILTDPWFTTSGFLYNLFMRRIYPLATELDSIKQCDVMLVSHNHPDHLSRHALTIARKLGSLVIGPGDVVRRAERHGVPNARELRPRESIEAFGIRITAVPAVHPLANNPIGFFLEGNTNIYYSGDTRFDWKIVEALRGKRVDVAFLQVSCAFRPLWHGADGMDINYAEELAKAIRPRCVIPMHFDCVGKYLDITTKKRVSEHSLDVEDVLSVFRRRLSRSGIECLLLFAGNEATI
ncbi:MAG: MBL fold metallo-hydrolase [Candidatus Abyssobacteria bacterium SURF_17]|jgi:L-ascorbate metabolism protein UlaG (beta-lactamase superfamily)|uniref:MBL fold metallo-hydrolase n=1 Tax=Candidatus Abyssobacteria bacterium SURF_17 TaxID=2093361 RepID=A0A419F8M5_9BACT|nr:MAG: MBL fold metallo-hydrolase [Candidatus Abyssubacteria bacterium SURF_17]